MLTIYIDDSGTSSGQNVAVAAGWIAKMPAWTLLDKDWKKVQSVESHKFSCMHMFDFVSGHKEFKSWDLPKKWIALRKLTPIIKKRALKGFGLGVVKKDFDEIVPETLRSKGYENHYTYAIRRVMGMIHDWRKSQKIDDQPIEYVFDFMNKNDPKREEIEKILTTLGTPADNLAMYGLREGGFHFLHKENLPPLQAADMFAWTVYRAMLQETKEKDANEIVKYIFNEFLLHKRRSFLEGGYNKRPDLINWVKTKGLSPLVSS